MAVAKQFQQLVKITNGTTAETDIKLSDPLAMQHIDITSGANSLNQISLAQSMCQPVAVTPNSTPSGGAYTATCSNYPDFSLTYTDKNGNTHYLVGMKARVIFTKGITYGSVSGGTYPTLNINSSGAIPLLAQGKTMAAGAAVDGQSLELTLIPYGNGVAWDADSNVRESTSDYTIYTDGSKKYTAPASAKVQRFSRTMIPNGTTDFTIEIGKVYILIESGSYPNATFNCFILSSGTSGQTYIENIVSLRGSLAFVDSTKIRFTYNFTGGGDTCFFSLIEVY